MKTEELVVTVWTNCLNELHKHSKRKSLWSVEHELVEFLRRENARDICVIKVPPEREYVDYFVVCGGLGTRHIRTMADNLAAEVWNDSGKREVRASLS